MLNPGNLFTFLFALLFKLTIPLVFLILQILIILKCVYPTTTSPLNSVPFGCLISFTDLNYPNCYFWLSFQILRPLLFSVLVTSITIQQVVQTKNVHSFWLFFFMQQIHTGSKLCCLSIKTYPESMTSSYLVLYSFLCPLIPSLFKPSSSFTTS